ncbi:DNA-binding domain-containing protein [Rhodoferax ferrireducens]|uniref:HvfC/BufC N-terminal domain-containing protein n=1 Tax=Rhodoferax ferrireducens TaxID=192843 RepID=UPI00298E5D2A|nr:DNA-binding domain-containing protein [Rhodoferax ferrireducens]WPC68468.1 DNA-binding domain-containing protein [Rhodoferax ferrireducens]
MNSQTAFANAVLDPELPCPGGLTTWNGSDPATRFAVYRNNVMVSLIDALADTYPVVQELVGEEFFRAMARVFAQANPPRSRVMAYYGHDFADFLATFPPATSVPYLADVARLEMARVRAYHAADVPPIQPETLQVALTKPEQLMALRLVLHPSVQVINSAFSVFSIWAAHQAETSIPCIDPDIAQAVLVFRNTLDVHTLEIAIGVSKFISGLQSGLTLFDAAGAASRADPAFDLSHALALLLRLQLISHLTSTDEHHEHTH